MNSVIINTLDKMRNFTVRAGGGDVCVRERERKRESSNPPHQTVIYTYSDHIVIRGTQRLQDRKYIAFIIFEVLRAMPALIPNTYEPYPKTRGPEFMKCLESLSSWTCGWWKHININY